MKKRLACVLVMIGVHTASAQVEFDSPNYKTFNTLNEYMNGAWTRTSDPAAWALASGATVVETVGCTTMLDKLAAAKLPDSTIMEIDRDTPDLAKGKHTLVEIRKACGHIQRAAYVQAVDFWAVTAMQDVKHLADNTFDVRTYKNCIATYDKAIKAGMPPSEPVVARKQKNPLDGSELLWTGTIESIKKTWCDAGIVKANAQQAVIEAPFRAVLKNDKLELALKQPIDEWQLPGGAQVSAIAQLARAAVWFYNDRAHGDNDCDGEDPRILHRYEFDAAHHLLGHTSKDFCGDPPRKAYR